MNHHMPIDIYEVLQNRIFIQYKTNDKDLSHQD
jgi:hypothetical protein